MSSAEYLIAWRMKSNLVGLYFPHFMEEHNKNWNTFKGDNVFKLTFNLFSEFHTVFISFLIFSLSPLTPPLSPLLKFMMSFLQLW